MYSVVTMMSTYKVSELVHRKNTGYDYYIVFLHHAVTSYLVFFFFIHQRAVITYHGKILHHQTLVTQT